MLSTQEVADRLGVLDSTVRIWLRRQEEKDGEKPRFPGALKMGRDWFVPEDALKGFVKRAPGRPKKELPPPQSAATAAKKKKSAKRPKRKPQPKQQRLFGKEKDE